MPSKGGIPELGCEGEQQFLLYVLIRQDTGLEEEEVRELLRQKLSEPYHFFVADKTGDFVLYDKHGPYPVIDYRHIGRCREISARKLEEFKDIRAGEWLMQELINRGVPVAVIAVVGSVAYGLATEDSNIDVAVFLDIPGDIKRKKNIDMVEQAQETIEEIGKQLNSLYPELNIHLIHDLIGNLICQEEPDPTED